jgi:hypothetical protein
MNICALCNRESSLEESHILPNFLYSAIFEEGYGVELDIARKTEGRRRSGYSEPLLCRECEARFSKLETYFADVWQHPTKRIRPEAIEEGTLEITGFEYRRFKLFHLSLIFRMGVSNLAPFSNIRLGPRLERLRSMLLDEDPGEPDEFALFGSALRDPQTGGWQDGIVHAPRAAKIGGQRIYTVLFAGARWHYFASSHTSGRSIRPQFTRNGTLTLVVRDWTKDPHLVAAANTIPELSPKMRKGRKGS